MERKYYCYGINPLTYGFSWFKNGKTINRIYIYEENNRYFEFFTGIEFVKNLSNYVEFSLSHEEIYLTIPETNIYVYIFTNRDLGYNSKYANSLTATDFANAIRSLIKDEDEIKVAIQDYFEQAHQDWQKMKDKNERKKTEQELIDDNNKQWLDLIFKGRK